MKVNDKELVFDIDKEYTVSNISVDNWSSDVTFEEVTGYWNTVMFQNVEEVVKTDQQIDNNQAPYYQIVVTTHYSPNDIGGDYRKVTIKINGCQVRTFGDYYHDKGDQKASAYLSALDDFDIGYDVTYEDKDDYI